MEFPKWRQHWKRLDSGGFNYGHFWVAILKFWGMYHDRPPPQKKFSFFPKNDVFFLGQKNKKPAEPSPRAIYLSSEIFVCQERGGAFYPNVVGD